ncbi:MAG: exopolysaccharide Pel transporter PelG [Deltaproteobacteria bacterium]
MIDSKTPDLKMLLKDICGIVTNPKDYFEIAAAVESLGYNDQMVKNCFGYEDVFVLSQEIFKTIQKSYISNEYSDKKNVTRSKQPELFWGAFRGIFSVLPMIISMLSGFLLNFSLWSFVDKNDSGVEKATAIAFSTILSMVIAGGFSQAFLRKAYGFVEQKSTRKIWSLYNFYFKKGLVTALYLAVLISCLAIISNIYRIENIIIFSVYFLLLTAVWLCMPILNIYKAEAVFALNLSFSIYLVFFLKSFFGINIIVSQITAMISFLIIHLMLVRGFLSLVSIIKKEKAESFSYNPRLLIDAYITVPYLIYGFLYYILIFMDRLIAWSANIKYILEPVLRMKGEYDLGMNWGIFVIIIPSIFIEVFTRIFINKIFVSSKFFSLEKEEDFKKTNVKSFSVLIIIFSAICVIGAIISLGAINYSVFKWGIALNPYYSDISRNVFYVSIIGYIFIVGGLLSNIYLLYLSQGKTLMRILMISIAINFIVGFILTRIFEAYFACIGFLAGAVAFFVLSTYYTLFVIKKLDYYLYINK